jgi:DNA-binding transcriptional ArsR family regulator
VPKRPPQPLNRVFQALADPTRRAILARLNQGPASVSELAQPFSMAMPSLLQHLRVLEAGGLVATAKAGRVRICTLRPDALAEAEAWLARQRRLWEGRLDRMDALVTRLHAEETQNDAREP